LVFFESPVDALLHYAGLYGDRDVILDSRGRRCSYTSLFNVSTNICRSLEESLSSEVRGGRVAIAPRNTVESVSAILGSWLCGSTVSIVDPLTLGEDLRLIVEESGFKTLLVEDVDFESLCPTAAELGVKCLSINKLYESSEGRSSWEGYWRPRAFNDAVVFYYGGIIGRTTEVIHTHSTLVAAALTTVEHYKLTSEDNVFVTPPLSHIFGFHLGLVLPIVSTVKVTLYSRVGPLDVGDLIKALELSKPSVITGVPLLYQKLIEAGYAGHEGLRFSVTGGAPLPLEVLHTWRKRTGSDILQIYGMTEAAPIAGTKLEDNPEGSIGVPMPGIDFKLVNPETLATIKDEGVVGELIVRGPVVMRGYKREEDTRQVFLEGGWLRTGDLVEVREGHLYFRGVRKRMLKYKGYPIFPKDIEYILEKHPAVIKAHVYGEESGELGQKPIAKVWVKKGHKIAESELLEWANSRLSRYKKLHKIEIIET